MSAYTAPASRTNGRVGRDLAALDHAGGGQDLGTVTDRRHRFVRGKEVAHRVQQRLVEPQILRRSPTGNHEGVVALGPHVGERGIDGEIMTPLLRVRLIALEVVDGRTNRLSGILARANGVYRVSDGK